MSRIASLLPRIGWGSYDQWEGPWFKGSLPYELPENPAFLDKVLAVITATEGGAYDAINMYDRCVATVGVIQWGEVCARRAVSRMLGLCHERDPDLLRAHLGEAGLLMRSVGSGGWVISADGQTDPHFVFLGGSSGRKGQWNDAQKAYARRVAATLASVWKVPEFRAAQLDFTRPKLLDFAFGNAAGLFAGTFPIDGWDGALRAGYLSFAANLPAVATRRVTVDVLRARNSKAVTIDLLRRLTFEPKVAIYPHRYNKIRPVLEQLFGVDLPDFAEDLRRWVDVAGAPALEFPDTTAVQLELLALGYDLGPFGADGKYGAKTTQAVRQFQLANGLLVDGLVGPLTLGALARARDRRLARSSTASPIPTTDPGASPQGRRSSQRMSAVVAPIIEGDRGGDEDPDGGGSSVA